MVILGLAVLTGCGQSHRIQTLELRHTLRSGETRRFPVRIEKPTGFDPSRDRAVFLFAGGYQGDVHWTVPGVVDHQGEALQLTIDGQDTRDGDTLSDALLDAGFAVVRYGSIHLDDQQHAQGNGLADPIGYNDTADLGARVWLTGLDEIGITPERCLVVAHSLGAPRSVHATIGQGQPAGGYVLMAGAYLSPTMQSPRRIVAGVSEIAADSIDFDGSGSVDPFEYAAWSTIKDGSLRDGSDFSIGGIAYPWACDALIEAGVPVLALWGSDDPMSYHGPVLEHLFTQADQRGQLTTRYFVRLGHNLGPERDGRVGGIDASVVGTIVEWITD